MKKLITAIIIAISAGCFAAPNIITVGQASGQEHNEFNNSWISKPIVVKQTENGLTVLQIGNMEIFKGRGHYRASCVLSARARTQLIKMLENGYELTRKYHRHNGRIVHKLGSIVKSKGDRAHGIKVFFFRFNRSLNPTGVILLIRCRRKNHNVKLYLYPSEIQQLIDVLQEAGRAYFR